MNPIRLIINDFLCHGRSEIDFSQFNSALIIGKYLGNDSYSNGVGKSTIFKSLEYVLFNQSDSNLEKVVRDDATVCKVIFYFESNSVLYRICRSRNKKGITDLSLHVRTENVATDNDIFIDKVDKESNIWKNISGRRAADTEEDIQKLVKINYRMFRNTSYFAQNDISGLTTLTAEKRKALLREVFQISIYSKLEKIAKEKLSLISKELDKSNILLDGLKSVEQEIEKIEKDLLLNQSLIIEKKELYAKNENVLEEVSNKINESNKSLFELESKTKSKKEKETSLQDEILKSQKSIDDFLLKKKNVNLEAKNSISIIDKCNLDLNEKLSLYNDKDGDTLNCELNIIKEKIFSHQASIKKYMEELDELKIPMPAEKKCKHCRQSLSEEHIIICKNNINERINELNLLISSDKSEVLSLNKKQMDLSSKIVKNNSLNKELNSLKEKITLEKQSLESKKSIHDEYANIISNFKKELDDKNKELDNIKQELSLYNLDESVEIKKTISDLNKVKISITQEIQSLNKDITYYSNLIAVSSNTLSLKKDDLKNKASLNDSVKILTDKYKNHQLVIESFSSSGIPNLIIQNILDDLQNEANELLVKIRPGLQLSFYVEKTRSDGAQDDTLDIKYYLNNRERDYDQLSGAQKISVSFSLKLGLSFLLQKMFGAEIKLLLLDEIDQSLDKIGVDAFADIVKVFQNDFKILVITHNDRLKDKFSHAIVVEQDASGISSAKVQSSW